MATTQEGMIADLQRANEKLRKERDVALAREAALSSDLRESLEYQTATSDVLKVISRSTFDLQPVLDTVAETAARLCDADQAAIYRREGESARLVANYGFPPEYETYTRALGAFPIDPNAAAVGQRTLVEGRPVHVHDVAAVPGYWEIAITLGKQRTSLGVPLVREGETIGNIMLARQRVEPFTDRQIELVSTFADQAVIAIENTRLITEQREALEQQTATAEVLQVINANPGNLGPVWDAMLEKAMRLCGAASGALHTYDGERFQAVALRGIPAAFAVIRRDRPLPTDPDSRPGQMLVTGRPVQLVDAMTDPYFAAHPNLRDEQVDLGGTRSSLNIPLLKDGTVVGAFVIYRKEPGVWPDKQVALLENFAAQAVIAMENARLLDELRQRTADLQQSLEYQTATSDVLKVISRSTFDLQPVLEKLLSIAIRLCNADDANLSQREADGLRILATRSALPEWAAALQGRLLPEDRSSVNGRAVLARRPVQIVDAAEDANYTLSGAVAVGHSRTCLGVPLLRDGVVIGAIGLARRRMEPFTGRQVELVTTFADQAVIAIENTRLLTEQREALEQQTATAEVLQVINASPGDLAPVFDAMLEKALRLCDAAFGYLLTYDGGQFHIAAQRGLPARYVEYMAATPLKPGPGGGQQRVLRGERFVQFIDMKDDEAYRSGANPAHRAMVDLGGARAGLIVPLRKDDALVGTFTIYRQEVRAFSSRSRYCRTSLRRRSSLWRMLGCWMKSASARTNYASRSRTWATAWPCSMRRRVSWPGTGSSRTSSICPMEYSPSI
jgi:GAF domain-containing protein